VSSGACTGFDGSQSFIKAGKAARELSQTVIALMRWSGNGRGPSLGAGFALSWAARRRLRPGLLIRARPGRSGAFRPFAGGRDVAQPSRPRRQRERFSHAGKKARKTVGQVGIGGRSGQIILPQFDISFGEGRKVRRFRHGPLYRRGRPIASLAPSPVRQKAAMLAATLHRVLRKPVRMSQSTATETPPIVIKKYANRRLYNTATSSYVTLDDLSGMVKEGGDFVVYDAKTGEDITRAVLTQIIVEEEQKGHNLLPISFLRQLIGFYGDSMQWLVPRYLEHTMKSFSHNQEQMRKSLQDAFGGLFPFGGLEQMGKQNMALFEKTMKMFSPFPASGERGDKPKDQAPAEDANLRELTDRLNALQKQIDALTGKGKG